MALPVYSAVATTRWRAAFYRQQPASRKALKFTCPMAHRTSTSKTFFFSFDPNQEGLCGCCTVWYPQNQCCSKPCDTLPTEVKLLRVPTGEAFQIDPAPRFSNSS